MNPVDEILDYWLGELQPDGTASKDKTKLWWGKGEAIDAEIRERFGELVERGGAGDLDEWKATARGRLALVILLDQFSRNIYRGTGRSFSNDEKARALAIEGIERGDHEKLEPMQAYFLFMPLMHSENLDHQERCIAEFENAARGCALAGARKALEEGAKYGRMHRDIVARFGRFPHRNELLGRDSTAEEQEFLKKPGSSF